MDGNFEKAASHATGEYIWFCGQDDVIGQGAVRKVLEVLLENSNIDFIFVNYSQNNHDMSKVVTDKMLQTDHDTLCKDPQLFFSITGIIFPTFLPAYVLRKTLWDTVDKRPFYQTHYIQIGVFLALLPNLTVYIIADPIVKGRIPDNGWQQDRLKVINIVMGFLQVVDYYHKINPHLITDAIYQKCIADRWKGILLYLFFLRIEGRSLDERTHERLHYIFSSRYTIPMEIILKMPRVLLAASYPVAKRIYRIFRRLRFFRDDER